MKIKSKYKSSQYRPTGNNVYLVDVNNIVYHITIDNSNLSPYKNEEFTRFITDVKNTSENYSDEKLICQDLMKEIFIFDNIIN